MTHNHDRGLLFDLQTLVDRRRALAVLGGTGLVALVGCGNDSDAAGPSDSTETASTATDASSVEEVPEETAGPYPGDGSNGPNVLTESGIVRRDITQSFGSASDTADGVPLTIALTIQSADDCEPLAGAAVYLWHCTREGEYSLYSESIASENYLRGVQEASETGTVTFTSIFPGAYSGRWPHIHFEVYASLDDATSAGPISATSQIALPQKACEEVYATDGYAGSSGNLAATSLDTDNVFSDDGGVRPLASMAGDTATGYTATLTIAV